MTATTTPTCSVIRKRGSPRVRPNMPSYEQERSTFSWEAERARLSGLSGGGLNIAHEAVDRHVAEGHGDEVALRTLGKDSSLRNLSFADLAALSGRFASALRGLRVRPGEVVASLLPRTAEVHVTALGTLKAGAVFSPLFPAFGPEPVRTRLALGDARVLVTTDTSYRKKIEGLRDALPGLKHVLVVRQGDAPAPAATLDLHAMLACSSPDAPTELTRADDPALLHFTSGTTGQPKGAMHVHGAVLAHLVTGRLALDLRPGDVFWCTADPGWVTGTSYGIIAPLANRVLSVVDEEEYDAERWYSVLEQQRVTVWYTAPTAVRRLMRAGAALARGHDLSALRFVASVGEPLNPEAVRWGQDVLGLPIHDNWWQTETGGIMIANFASMDVKPGSMGRPLPGVEAGIVRRSPDGTVHEIPEAGVEGELALRPGCPSLFRGYLGDEERTRRCFANGWYLTGDLARRDADGYYWFVGRADDVIKSSGHLIGPFEVESALMEHPAVAEAAVVGKPDDVAGEIVKAFVLLALGHRPSAELEREILGFARRRLGPAVAPKELQIVPSLPRTRSGKIMRRLLKARELGLPEGDTSTLEDAS